MDRCKKIVEEITSNDITSKMNMAYCTGLNMTDPYSASMDDIEKWYNYNKNYIFSFGHTNLYQLLCAMDNKKIAVIDHDFDSEEYFKGYMDEKEAFVRCMLLFKCDEHNIRYLNINADDITIFYNKNNWENAVIYYLFRENLFKNLKLPLDLKYFNDNYPERIFRSILLGYNFHDFYYEEIVWSNRDNFKYVEDIIKEWNVKSEDQKRDIYQKIYKLLYENEENNEKYMHLEKLHEDIEDIIDDIKIKIKSDPKWKIFGYGLDKEKLRLSDCDVKRY
jgi:hypothetical protein